MEFLIKRLKKTTRKGTKTIKGKTTTSYTTIDLAFLDKCVTKKLHKIEIEKETKSDHFLVDVSLNLELPKKYTEVTYFKDPTRRPPIKGAKLEKAKKHLKITLDDNIDLIKKSTHSDGIKIISNAIVQTLDIHAPLNKAGPRTKKIYRFPLPENIRKLGAERRKLLIEKRRLERRKTNPATVEDINRANDKLKICHRTYRKQIRKEKQKFYHSDITKKLANQKDMWDFIKSTEIKPSEYIPDKLEIKGKTGNDMANYMASYLYDRAH